MIYCKRCILPSTRPGLEVGIDGICNACKSNSLNKTDQINWQTREKEFIEIIKDNKSKTNWDCVVPVSGGKDSTWAVIKALKYGLKPLCVTWKTAKRNKIGEKNLNNLINLGVDHIDFSINPRVEKIFTKKAFISKGIPLIPMHLAIYNLPIRIAIDFKIPIVLYGENSAIEYGGDKKYHTKELTKEWLLKFGVSGGTVAKDWVSDDLSEKDLIPYSTPMNHSFKPKALFLSTFFEWSVFITKKSAQENGLIIPLDAKTGTHAFSDIDEEFLVTIHHWLKWYKFGFTRRWDNLSLDIRSGKLSREDAINSLISSPEKLPKKEIKEFSDYIDISEDDFFKHANKFRNHEVWSKDEKNNWHIKNPLHQDLKI